MVSGGWLAKPSRASAGLPPSSRFAYAARWLKARRHPRATAGVAARLMPDDWLDAFAAAGTPQQVSPGCEGFTPLWAGAATQEQAEAVVATLNNSEHFKTNVPFPTVSKLEPKFDPNGYWRGPVWLDQAYFILQGLRRSHFDDLAEKLQQQLFDSVPSLREGNQLKLFEYYNPNDGNGIGAKDFGWTAASALLMVTNQKEGVE